LCQKFSYLYLFQNFLKNQRKSIFGNSSFVFHFLSIKKFSQEFFFVFSFPKHFVFLTLEQSIQYLSIGSYFCEKNYLWSFKITKREFMLIGSLSCKVFLFGFVPYLLCGGACIEREIVYSWWKVVIPQWRSFCERSCVDIVKIVLCEGGDVEQWLESRNIS